MKRKIVIFLLCSVLCIGLGYGSLVLFDKYEQCNIGIYLPRGSGTRFVEIVIYRYTTGKIHTIERFASENAIDNLKKISIDPGVYEIIPEDSLKSSFDYRIKINENEFIYVKLDYEDWPVCPDEEFSDLDVINHFYLEDIWYRDYGNE